MSIVFLVFGLLGCGKKDEKEKIVARVNDAPILLKELQLNVALMSKRDPGFKVTGEVIEEELDAIIDKKLLIQEAMKMGVLEDEKFVRTIRTFWEQTLIKNLMELKKNREWKDYLFVQEEEIKNRYEKLKYRVSFKLNKASDKNKADSILKKALKGEVKKWDEEIGPVNFGELSPGLLRKAFKMAAGEIKVFFDSKDYFVIYLAQKDIVSLPPIQKLHKHIKAFILEEKRRAAMEEWMNDVRKNADVQIQKQVLYRLTGRPGAVTETE